MGGLAPTSGGQLGRRDTAGSGPAEARAGGACVRTVAGGAGSLTSEAQMAVGGHGEREARARVGSQEGNGVGRAHMNSDDF
jgi:hypothetical protein